MVMRRCNHCNGQLGLIVHRKWMLRFCSKSCKKAYEHKLQEERRAKLRRGRERPRASPTLGTWQAYTSGTYR